MKRKILITGSTGKVGEAVTNILKKEITDLELILLTNDIKSIAPIKNQKVVQAFYEDVKWLKDLLLKEKPDVIINTAAMTNVDACEDDHKLAMNLNAILPETLARTAKVIDAHLISFSTDYIFDGEDGPYDEDSIPNPISFYGKSKLAGENAIKVELNSKYTIIRTNVVYGLSSYGKGDFISWLSKNLDDGKKLTIIDGQWCNPTYSDDIAWAVLKIVENKNYGVYNIAGKGYYNRYDIAKLVAEIFEYDEKLITKIPEKDLKQKAKRPSKAGLMTLKAESELGIDFLDLKNGLIALKFMMSKKNEYN